MKRKFINHFTKLNNMKYKISKLILLLSLFFILPNLVYASEESSIEEDQIIGEYDERDSVQNIPLLGEVDIEGMPLILSTILIAGADGFNPCSIWVLLFLLGMIIHTGSRKKIAFIGGTFLIVTSLIYGVFIAGIHQFQTLIYETNLEIIIFIIAMVFGLVNVKDYFWYKKGVSFTVPDKYKPKFAKDIRELMKAGSYLALFIGTVIIASGVALVELPCTAGLPAVWTGILASLGITGLEFFIYLLVYLLVYLLIEIIILIIVLISLKSFRIDEFKGRVLKLFGGLLIIALAFILLLDRAIMYDFVVIFLVMLMVILLTALIVLVDRLIIRGDKK